MTPPTVRSASTVTESSDVALIDPRAPRFGQTITMSVLLVGIGLQEPLFVSAIAAILLFGAPVVDLPELALLGHAVALVHAGMAAIGGTGDYCIGCRMDKPVGFFRRLGLV